MLRPLEGEGGAQRSLGVGVNSAQRSLGVDVTSRLTASPPVFNLQTDDGLRRRTGGDQGRPCSRASEGLRVGGLAAGQTETVAGRHSEAQCRVVVPHRLFPIPGMG